jgi:ribose transport system ATP-binding protein
LIKELDKQKIVTHMIGRDEDVGDIGKRKDKLGSTKLELKDVSTARGHHRINLQVQEGEVLGLYGLVGAGRSELAKAIMGADRLTGGEIRIDGKPASIKSVQDALQNWRIGYVSENRKEEGLILAHSVAKNTGITIWHRLGKVLSLFTDAMERLEIKPFVEKLNVITPSLEQSVGNLFGGNQQKVSVAKWLAAKVEILIIDEPTVGIDIRTKGDLHRLIWNLAEQGVAVLLISSDMPEMVLLADRVVVMKDMQIVGDLSNNHQYEVMSSRIMHCIHESGSEVGETLEDGVLASQGA